MGWFWGGPPSARASSYAPVAAWSFDEGTGTTAEDLTGNGHTATIEGATVARGRYGDGLAFNGMSSCVSVEGAEDLRFTEEFSIEAWVRPEGSGEEALPVITMLDTGAASGEEEFLYELLAGQTEVPKAWVRKGGTSGFQSIAGAEELREHAWAHLALTDDGATLRLYVNGVLVRTKPAPNLTTATGPLEIGCEPYAHFKGRIDEVRIYDRVLGAGEVDSDMEAPLQTQRSGPVAEYSFDEGSGETATDLSGHEHTATIEGATVAPGRYGKGLAFDGEEDCVQVPVDEELQATEEFTLEAWVRPEGSGEESLPVIAMDDENSGPGEEQFSYELFGGQDEAPKGWVRKDEESGTWNVYGEEPLPEKSWSHLTLTDDGGVIRLYVDGVLGNEENSTDVAPPLTEAEGPLTIGCGIQYGAFRYFKGRIDEVRVYDRALKAGEVAADTEAPIQTPKHAPVAAWSFDEGTGTTAEDLTGNGHTATIEGATVARGRYGDGLAFNGMSSCVSVEGAEDLRFTEEFSIEAWVRPEGSGEEALPVITMLDTGAASGEEEFLYELLAGQTEVPKAWVRKGGTSGFQSIAGAEELREHAWAHLALTDDGATLRLYVNGVLVRTKPAPNLTTATGPLEIGCEPYAHFKGRIDEVRIYDRVLGAGEVDSDMEAPLQTQRSGPVAEYSFDEGSGETATDLSGHEHTATIEGATVAPGRYGKGLAFDGEEDCVQVPVDEELQATEEFTLEAWVRPEGSGEESLPVIAMDDENSGPGEEQFSYELFGGQDEAPKGWVRKDEESGTWNVYGEEPLPEKSWSHLTLTDDGGVIRLYVDGVLGNEENSTDVAPPLTEAEGPLTIGCGIQYGAFRYFKGRIDEVRVYDRALKAGEVAADTEAPIQTPKHAPVAAWSFDEGTGTTAEDLTGNGHTATIHGAEWTTRGKYGGGMQFPSGKEAYLSVPDSPELEFADEFTLEAWVRPEKEDAEAAPLITKQVSGGLTQPYFLSEDSTESDRPYGGTQGNTEEEGYARAVEPLPTKTWSHLTLTFNGARTRLYVDGKLTDENDAPPPIDGEGNLEIGGATEAGSYFTGRIDEVRVFNRAIGSNEATDITPPTEATHLSAIEEDEDMATVNWNWSTDPVDGEVRSVSGVALYYYRSRLAGSGWSPWQSTVIPAFQVEGVELNAKVEVQLLAQDEVGNFSSPVDQELTVAESIFTPEHLGIGDGTDGPYDVYPQPNSNEEEVSKSRINGMKSLSVHSLDDNPDEEKLCAGTGENPCHRYNGFRAGSYAQTWSLEGQDDAEAQKNHNQKFEYFGGRGGDCTNFASQALHAGGMLFMRASGLDDPNAYADGENNVSAYYHGQGAWWSIFADLSFLAPGERKYDYTRAWGGAYGLYEHLTEYELGHVLKGKEHIRRGDLIFWSEDGDLSPEFISHTQIVTKVTPGGIWVVQHSKNYEEDLGNVVERIANKEHRYLHYNYELYVFEPVYGAANIG